jgi:acetoacetyl-CoA reductase
MCGESGMKIAVVTGGTRGIGASIAKALKAEGYKVAANYGHRDSDALAFHAETGVEVFKWDVADIESCRAGVKAVEEKLGGPVEVLVNNAGITRDAPMHKMSAEQWDAVVRTNLTSCFNMSRLVIDGMRERGFGRIVNISSVNAQLGQFGQTNYSAAKAGILGFTKALARETAAKGITVNAIAPGYIDTEMVRAVPEDVLKKIIDAIPVKRLGKPEEIARTVIFLVGEHSGFITGETVSINGGQFME